MMAGVSTVLEKLLNRCEAAFLAKTPILYICTDEIEVIEQVLRSDRMVVRLCRITDNESGDYGLLPFAEQDKPEEIVNLHTQLPGADFIRSYFSAQESGRDMRAKGVPQITAVHLQSSVTDVQFEGLVQYVRAYVSERDDNSALRSSVVVLHSAQVLLPDRLIPYAEIIDVEYPDDHEIAELVTKMMLEYGFAPFEDPRDFNDLCVSLAGFSFVQITNLLRRILSADDVDGIISVYDGDRVQGIIRSAKEQVIKRGQVLELEKTMASQDEIGGMARFIAWLEQQRASILRASQLRAERGIDCPKGVLLCGVPGCGKSLAAETLSAKLGIPLLKMDVGRLMGRYVGESEHNMLLALKQAEAMAPCILWIDELDKGFSGVGGSAEDSGIFKRMFGSLLTWMQNNDKPCFIFATANNIGGLPKEFFRSGRFDALFSIFMPTFEECVDILRKRMEKASSKVTGHELFNAQCYNSKTLEAIVGGFCEVDADGEVTRKRLVTGADIQKIVNLALIHMHHKAGDAPPEEIMPYDWAHAVGAVLKDTTVYGDGPENLDNIAVCYIRLLRNNFFPAAKTVLFSQDDYHVITGEQGQIEVKLKRKSEQTTRSWPTYDQVMYNTLYTRMERLASAIENAERDRMIRT